MLKNFLWVMASMAMAFASASFAGSEAGFPKGWENWPITKKGAIPGNQTPVAATLPPIVQETFKTYNWINNGKGSAYNLRFNPAQKKTNGAYPDGSTAVLELTDIKVLLVTEHLLGEPQYGVYSYDGKDMTTAHSSLNTPVCVKCHSGYKEFCSEGICSAK